MTERRAQALEHSLRILSKKVNFIYFRVTRSRERNVSRKSEHRDEATPTATVLH